MASVELSRIAKAFGETSVLKGVSLSVQNGEFLDSGWPVGLWQVHDDPHRRRTRSSGRGRDLDRWFVRGSPAAARTPGRDGVPELCPLPSFDREGEHRAPSHDVPASAVGAHSTSRGFSRRADARSCAR